MLLFMILASFLISTSEVVEPTMHDFARMSAVDKTKPVTLDSLRGRYRPLLVFAPTAKDQRFVTQAKLAAEGTASLHERQMLLVLVDSHREAGLTAVASVESAELSPEDAAKARQRFQIAPEEFAVILIGKDGGEKFRAHTPVTIERLNTVIDAMPMRQQEVRNGNSK